MVTLNNIQNNTTRSARGKEFSSPFETAYYAKKQIDHSSCSGQILVHKLEGIILNRFSLKLKGHRSLRFKLPKDYLHVYFLFNGQLHIQMDSRQELLLQKDTHNVFYTPPGSSKIRLSPGPCDLFYVRIPLTTFLHYVPGNKKIHPQFFKKTKRWQSLFLKDNRNLNDPRIYRIIDEIYTTRKPDELHTLFIKAKIMELLSIQIEQFHNCGSLISIPNKENAQKMCSIKNFLIENLGEYYSLKELAIQAGTNEFTLKKEFKQLFGTTVFGFWREVKMEKAQELLLKNRISIKEISEIIGYKNPQHFSTAFKKSFGMSPTAFKNMSV